MPVTAQPGITMSVGAPCQSAVAAWTGALNGRPMASRQTKISSRGGSGPPWAVPWFVPWVIQVERWAGPLPTSPRAALSNRSYLNCVPGTVYGMSIWRELTGPLLEVFGVRLTVAATHGSLSQGTSF